MRDTEFDEKIFGMLDRVAAFSWSFGLLGIALLVWKALFS